MYQEYKKALAALGAEPLPLPEPAEGSQFILQLLDWLLSEFEGLEVVMIVANDNAASVSFEGLVGNLLRAGAIDLSKLKEGFQYVPYEGLSEEVNRIQDVKISYFERFWEPSGKVAVRTLAAAATEVGLVPSVVHFSSACFLLGLSILCRGRLLISLRRTIECPRLAGLLRGMTPVVRRGLRSRD